MFAFISVHNQEFALKPAWPFLWKREGERGLRKTCAPNATKCKKGSQGAREHSCLGENHVFMIADNSQRLGAYSRAGVQVCTCLHACMDVYIHSCVYFSSVGKAQLRK
jgi:hypothetical protein